MTEQTHNLERPMMTVFPSIASLAAGRALGALYESVPIRLGRLKLSHLMFPLPTSPLALVLYAGLKAIGPRYVLTTRRLCIRRSTGSQVIADVPLDEIGRIEVVTTFGQRFYRAGTLIVRDHVGTERLRLAGVVRPEMFRETILEARDAVISTDAALRVIEGRHIQDAGAA